MEISIGSYKCRLEVCILIIAVFWIMFGHLLCSCSTVSFQEGFEVATMLADKATSGGVKKIKEKMSNITSEPVKKDKNNSEKKEGFKNNSASAGVSYADSKSNTFYKDPSTWGSQSSTFSIGAIPSSIMQNSSKQPIPLPEGELNFFSKTEFKPECCPNTFSTGSGCACMSVDQYKYLRDRGSNNIPFSEY